MRPCGLILDRQSLFALARTQAAYRFLLSDVKPVASERRNPSLCWEQVLGEHGNRSTPALLAVQEG